jgi:hypothetical protein
LPQHEAVCFHICRFPPVTSLLCGEITTPRLIENDSSEWPVLQYVGSWNKTLPVLKLELWQNSLHFILTLIISKQFSSAAIYIAVLSELSITLMFALRLSKASTDSLLPWATATSRGV